MADAFTSYFNLTMPEVGASRDTWGAKQNQNMAIIDSALAGTMMPGGMIDFGGALAPPGWLLCDGMLHNIAQFSKLFAVIGNRWGGDGVSNFATPDSRCRMMVGVGSNIADALGQVFSYGLGGKGGANGQLIGQANLPNYALTETANGAHPHSGAYTDTQGIHQHSGQTDQEGAHAHNLPGRMYLNDAGGIWIGAGAPHADQTGGQTDAQGTHGHYFYTDWQGNHSHSVTIPGTTGGHSHAPYLGGGGQALRVMVMYLAVTKIIFTGVAPSQTVAANQNVVAGPIMSPMRGMN